MYPADWDQGLSSSHALVQKIAAEYLAMGPVDPDHLRWADSVKHPEGFSTAVDRSPAVLEPGARIDRFGKPQGHFVFAEGVPYHERALPPHNLEQGYHRYEVLESIPVWAGRVAPAHGVKGGGVQYFTQRSVADLIIGRYIREVY